MKLFRQGFTVVELLIVIVVIAILASITIVMYSGTRDQADYSRAQSDMKHINDALTVYRAQNGKYPIGNGSFQQASATLGASSSTPLVPSYLDTGNLLTAQSGFSYLYRADTLGVNYMLIRIKGTSTSDCSSLSPEETTGNPLLKTGGATCPGNSWGYWSSGAASW